MKPKFTFLIVTLALLLSCKKEGSKSCGGEEQDRVTLFAAMTPALFSDYIHNGSHEAANATYQIRYYIENTRAKIRFETEVTDVCPFEEILVSPTLALNHADATLSDSLYISGTGSRIVVDNITPSNGVLYDLDEIYTFDTNENDATYTVYNVIGFPSQGSFSLDSAYFFNNLSSFKLSTNYKAAN